MPAVTLEQFKAHLNKSLNDTSQDDELEMTLGGAESLAERIVGGPLTNRGVTEDVYPVSGGTALLLTYRPVLNVISISTAGTTVGTSDVYVAPGRVLRRRNGYGFSPYSSSPYTVTYTAGLGVTAPPAVQLAVLIIGSHLWDTQRGNATGNPGREDEYGTSSTVTPGYGYAVPNRALELLSQWASETGLA